MNPVNVAIGVDLGSSAIVIGAVMRGGVEVITNECNYRATPNLVTYGHSRATGPGPGN